MAARPPAGATFEVERVGRARSQGSLAALAVGGILVAMVGIAVLGRGATTEAPALANASDSPAPADSTPDARLLAPAPGDHVFLAEPIDLQSPGIGPITLVTPRLLIFGTVLVRADHIEVALEARNNRVIDHAFFDTTDPNGGLRRDHPAEFRVEFDVPYPRPNGTMWVVVTAYDARGVPLGGERRPFTVGPIKGA